MKKNKKVLLIGGSGNLGSCIFDSKTFPNIIAPTKKELNILKIKSLKKFFQKKDFDLVINCAAMARMRECEKNPSEAINTNINGTINLVKAIIKYEKEKNKNIKFIHISTDGVYPSTQGNYSESSELNPYNVYGWTKLASEFIVKFLKNYVIIRTRFFNKRKIKFNDAATDIFTSSIEVNELIKYIKKISLKNFIGIVNVGSARRSDFDNYKIYKKNIKPTKRKRILKKINFDIAKDSSLNLNLLKKILD